jgi:surfactin synthase thioesterase subunit
MQWQRFLAPGIIVVPLEPSRHPAKKTAARSVTLFETLVRDLQTKLEARRDKAPYAFWGHSMGAVLAYELAARLQRVGQRGPTHLFVSGMRPPHHGARDLRLIQELSDVELLTELRQQGGLPEFVLSRPDFLEHLLGNTRRDLESFRTYRHDSELTSVRDLNLSVLIGSDDEINFPDVHEWNRYTTGRCNVHVFEGGHFFIFDNRETISKLMLTEIGRGDASRASAESTS